MTAIEWLEQKAKDFAIDLDLLSYFQQAKEMEKQQIIDAHGSKLKKSRGTTNYEYWYTGDQYYNETFKNTKK